MPTPPPVPTGSLLFADLGLAEPLVASVAALGYEEATPVQRAAIPILLTGKDLLGQAATGTGKTAAFALPLIHRLIEARDEGGTAARRGRPKTRGLVLVPTRELAMQVAEATHKYARGSGLTVIPVYGGASMSQQIRALDRGVDIVVATPGRALDLLRRDSLQLDALQVLVLDEADEMLDMGFAEDLDAILEATPETRQTALFSATMPPRLRVIAEKHLRDPQRVAIAAEKRAAGTMPRVRQLVYLVPRAHKATALQRVLDMESPTSAIVFCRTRLEVDSLVETLSAHGYRAEPLHGGMAQRQRETVLNRLRAQKLDLLIATDVAARGLDIEQLSHVINYDVPSAPEAYVHRIGRTGRAGREGVAITLAEPREHRLLRSIEQVTKSKMEMATLPTLADLRAKRLELTRASLRERLVQGDLDDVRIVVETLCEEYDLIDVAAAAVAIAHAAVAGDGDDKELPALLPPPAREPRAEGGFRDRFAREARAGRERGPRPPREDDGGSRGGAAGEGRMARLFIGAGRRAGVRPGDLVGAIANEAGISSRDLGAIQIADNFSLVEVPDGVADDVINAMRGATLRGQRITIRRDRDV